jgi:hypothetical protein
MRWEWNLNIFCELGALATFQDPRTNKFLTWKERKKEKKKRKIIAKIADTTLRCKA